MPKPDTDVFDLPFDDDEFDSPEDEFDSPDETPAVVTGNGTRTHIHPVTGKRVTTTRASAFASTGADDYTLDEWKRAHVVLGIGARDDLYGEAQSLHAARPEGPIENYPKGWWLEAAAIAHEAIDAARAKSGAHKGTAYHRFGEMLDRGRIGIDDVPVRWREHMRHDDAMRAAAGLSVHPGYIETGIFTDKLHHGVNGRLDNLLSAPGGWLIVSDRKSGRNAPEGKDEIAIQLAIYANAEWHMDLETGECVPAPANIRKDVALIHWVPIDDPSRGRMIPIDITWGWQAARAIGWIKAYRNRARRKNNGLELPLSVLTDVDPYRDFDPDCDRCDSETHTCPGCGAIVSHLETVCYACKDYYDRNGV
jgi:hypothetical protein